MCRTRRGAAFWAMFLGLGVAGCDQPNSVSDVTAPRRETVEAKLAVEAERMENDILEKRVTDMEEQISSLRSLVLSLDDAHEGLRKVVNQNARASNEDAVRDMTRRGACGTEQEWLPSGGYIIRNRQCTLADLRKAS